MTVAVTLRPARPERRAFTVTDLERMTEAGILDPDERLEIIDGEIITMAAKGNRHERIKVAITALWGQTRPLGFMFAQETGLRLSSRNYLEPDFIVYATTKKLSSITGSDILLAVEVADSSLDYDLGRKSRVYAAFGVRELWVVNAARREIHRHDGVGEGGYVSVTIHGAGERLVPRHAPDGFALRLDDLEEP